MQGVIGEELGVEFLKVEEEAAWIALVLPMSRRWATEPRFFIYRQRQT